MRRQLAIINHRITRIAFLSAALTALLFQFDLNFIESKLYDLRVAFGPTKSADPRIALVAIDDITLERLGTRDSLSVDHFSTLLDRLILARPRAIAITTPLGSILENGKDFLPLYKEIEHAKRANIPLYFGESSNTSALFSAGSHLLLPDRSPGEVLRSVIPDFYITFAEVSGFTTRAPTPFFFRYRTDPAPDRAYSMTSAIDLLSSSSNLDRFKDKIVLVGATIASRPMNFQRTSFSKKNHPESTLVVHANILDSVISGSYVLPAPSWVNILMTFFTVAIVLWSVLEFTPLFGVLSTLASLAFVLLIGQLAFNRVTPYGLWILEAQAVIGLILTYYLSVPYRLIREYKKRWDYQKRNDVLLELETLKRNFLSLVTHDLKTPVARIQGLAELVLSKLPDHIKAETGSSLREIIRSTDELNHFVSSVLELTRIESEQASVNLIQKDINDVVESSIESFRNVSWAKEISIQADLEPLFPIYIDPPLIQKVIRNLIDNAIKYSPRGSSIFVSTYEEGDSIVVSVQDQGFGISETDQKHLFSKFYRSKNDQNSSISGTGLGLYLSRFFVESHGGEMRFESREGSGSVFEILLPSHRKGIQKTETDQTRPGLTRFFSLKEKRNV